jgi:hypothetical protein
MKEYRPNPIDTSSVVLPAEISELIEKLAENTHEIWSEQRLKDGWTYGSERDDQLLMHPCLVPYNELPETEKIYDRNTAAETLKCMIAMGFRIVK